MMAESIETDCSTSWYFLKDQLIEPEAENLITLPAEEDIMNEECNINAAPNCCPVHEDENQLPAEIYPNKQIAMSDSSSECSTDFDILEEFENIVSDDNVGGIQERRHANQQVLVDDFFQQSSKNNAPSQELAETKYDKFQRRLKELVDEFKSEPHSMNSPWDDAVGPLPSLIVADDGHTLVVSKQHLKVLVRSLLGIFCTFVLIYLSIIFAQSRYFIEQPDPIKESTIKLEDLVTTCLGEQYLFGLLTGNDDYLNSKVCIMNTEKYTKLMNENLSPEVLSVLPYGLSNQHNLEVIKFGEKFWNAKIITVINQLRYFKLLPIEEAEKEAEDWSRNSYKKNPDLKITNESIEQLHSITAYLKLTNELLQKRIDAFSNSKSELWESMEITKGGSEDKFRRLAKQMRWLYDKDMFYADAFNRKFHSMYELASAIDIMYRKIHSQNEYGRDPTGLSISPTEITADLVVHMSVQLLKLHDLRVAEVKEINQSDDLRIVEDLTKMNFVSDNDKSLPVSTTLMNYSAFYLEVVLKTFQDIIYSMPYKSIFQNFLEGLKKMVKSSFNAICYRFANIREKIQNMPQKTYDHILCVMLIYIVCYVIAFAVKRYVSNRGTR